FDTPFSPNLSGVAVGNGVVYFQSALNATLFALDAATGAVLATVNTGGQSSGPAISRGQIYLGTGDAAFTFLTGQPLRAGSMIAVGLPDKQVRSAQAMGPRISIGDATVTPARPGWVKLTFQVSLSEAPTRPVTVRFSTANGTAQAGRDYRPISGIIRFAAGQTIKMVAVLVRANLVSGDSETFRVKLRQPTHAVLEDAEGIATIRRTV